MTTHCDPGDCTKGCRFCIPPTPQAEVRARIHAVHAAYQRGAIKLAEAVRQTIEAQREAQA